MFNDTVYMATRYKWLTPKITALNFIHIKSSLRNNNYAIHIQQAVSAGGGAADPEPRLHRAGGAAGGRGHHHPHRRRLHQVQKVSGVLGDY